MSPFGKELVFGVEYQYLLIQIIDSGIGILVFAPIFLPVELHFLVHTLLLLLGEFMRELRKVKSWCSAVEPLIGASSPRDTRRLIIYSLD